MNLSGGLSAAGDSPDNEAGTVGGITADEDILWVCGVLGLEEAHRRGIPVIIMEPLRGGKLANVPEEAKNLIASYAGNGEVQ